jgi:hypothetical protein
VCECENAREKAQRNGGGGDRAHAHARRSLRCDELLTDCMRPVKDRKYASSPHKHTHVLSKEHTRTTRRKMGAQKIAWYLSHWCRVVFGVD